MKKVLIAVAALLILLAVLGAHSSSKTTPTATHETIADCFRSHGWRVVSGNRAFPPSGRQGVVHWTGVTFQILYSKTDRDIARTCRHTGS